MQDIAFKFHFICTKWFQTIHMNLQEIRIQQWLLWIAAFQEMLNVSIIISKITLSNYCSNFYNE